MRRRETQVRIQLLAFTAPRRPLNVTQRTLEKAHKTQVVQRSLSAGTDSFPLTPRRWTEAQAHL